MCGSDITEEDWSDRIHVGIDCIQNFIKFVEKQFSLQIYETQHVSKRKHTKAQRWGCFGFNCGRLATKMEKSSAIHTREWR